MLQAKLSLEYGITSFDKFNGYWLDFIIYGMLYPMAGGFLQSDFVAIDLASFAGDDMLCYNLKGGCI